MKVYVVTSGSYSDFGIEQVFTTKEKAEEFIKLAIEYGNGSINEDIDEYELDPEIVIPRKKFKYFYYLQMDKEGNTSNIGQANESIIKTNRDDPKQEYYFYEEYYPDKKVVLSVTVNANDKGHAIKITNELRTQILLRKEWIDDLEDQRLKAGWKARTKF